jgi:signal transduction histidine kinase
MAEGQDTALLERMAALEAENRRIFEEAQREADAMFAQYQLSQLLASGSAAGELGSTICGELIRLTGAQSGLLWLAAPDGGSFRLTVRIGLPTPGEQGRAEPPINAAGDDYIHAWAERHRGAFSLTLADDRPAAVLCLLPGTDPLDDEGLRVLQLSRHELAVALRGAQLREVLDQERRELSDIVEGATDAILQVDAVCHVMRANGAAERLLGRNAAALVGLHCSEALGCEAAGGHAVERCPLAEVIHGEAPIAYRESDVRDGQGLPVRVAGGYSRSSRLPDGPVRATAILRDIRAARSLEELREGFVATVSHELRTPLALIKGYADTLLHLPLKASEQRAYIERIEEATQRLTSLVTEILDITQLDADSLVLERARARIEGLVARLRGDLAISGSDGRVRVELPPNLPPVEVDGARVGQILDNLVSNALKYAPSDSPVTISASAADGWLTVTVDDEGIGIPDGDAALVFEPFHRARNVRESRISGTGLGLYISRRLVEAHGGQLRLERRVGSQGTRARFTLPLAPSRAMAAAAPAAAGAAGTAGPAGAAAAAGPAGGTARE